MDRQAAKHIGSFCLTRELHDMSTLCHLWLIEATGSSVPAVPSSVYVLHLFT